MTTREAIRSMRGIAGLRRTSAVAAALAITACAGASAATQTGSTGIVTFGPYRFADFVQTNTCGDVWAHGPLRHGYVVYPQNADGSYLVTAAGHVRFVTFGGRSLGACNNGQPDDGATAAAHIHVGTDYSFVFLVHGGTLNPDATCADPCGPGDFFAAAFGPAATFDLLSWSGTMTSRCNGDAFFLLTPDGVEHDGGDITGSRHAC
jgi:hypothetical protein